MYYYLKILFKSFLYHMVSVNSLDFNDDSRHEQLQNLNQKLLLELVLNLNTSSELTNYLFNDFTTLRKLDEIEAY